MTHIDYHANDVRHLFRLCRTPTIAALCLPSPTVEVDQSGEDDRWKVTSTREYEEKVNSAQQCCDCPLNPTTIPSAAYKNTEKSKITRTQNGSFSAGMQAKFVNLTFNLNAATSNMTETESDQEIEIPKINLRCSQKYIGYRRKETTVKREEHREVLQFWKVKTETVVSYGAVTRTLHSTQTYDPCTDEITGEECDITVSS